MTGPVHIISLRMPFRMGSVNSYLLETADGFILVDTGAPNARKQLTDHLQDFGCQPGDLHLIVLTHGDFDHIGNAAYLRSTYGSRIVMHAVDARMAETGDMFAGRSKSNPIIKILAPRLIGFGKADYFTADILIDVETNLSEYGLDAEILLIPGHSRGSLGVLTAADELFCGDLFENTRTPAINSLIDNLETARQSAARLRSMDIKLVYPGHGKPFAMDQLPG